MLHILGQLFDPKTGGASRITPDGEVVVAPYSYSKTYSTILADTDNHEVISGITGHDFILMSFWISAGKTVSPTTAATVLMYEANPHDLGVSLQEHVDVGLVQNQIFTSPSNLQLRLAEGASLVASTDDATVKVSAVGYYIPKVARQ